MEQPDSRELNREMREEHKLRALPLFLGARYLVRLQLPLAEVRHSVSNNPWNASSKVDNFMHQETHQSRRNDRVPNPDIPRSPLLFQPAERGKVGARVEVMYNTRCRLSAKLAPR